MIVTINLKSNVLSGLSTEALHIVNPEGEVTVTANWFFNIVSTFFIAIVVTIITELKQWKPVSEVNNARLDTQMLHSNFKGLGLYSFIFIGIVLLLVIPENAPLRNQTTGSISRSPFISSIVVIIALYFAGAGLVFSRVNQTFKNSTE